MITFHLQPKKNNKNYAPDGPHRWLSQSVLCKLFTQAVTFNNVQSWTKVPFLNCHYLEATTGRNTASRGVLSLFAELSLPWCSNDGHSSETAAEPTTECRTLVSAIITRTGTIENIPVADLPRTVGFWTTNCYESMGLGAKFYIGGRAVRTKMLDLT